MLYCTSRTRPHHHEQTWSLPPGFRSQLVRFALLFACSLLLAFPDRILAQIVTNITPTGAPGSNLGTQTTSSGSTTVITGGTRPGNGTNLFHSFDAFSLGTGDIAHFQNNTGLATTNIIGRVTGGIISNIDGTLRTNNPLNPGDPVNFGTAHLWLMNPTGIMLGPNAVLDVGGAVTFTTADYLRFQNSTTLFDLASTPTSLGPLTVAPVTSFGFLASTPPSPITVHGSILKVPEGQSLSLVGGDLTMQSGTLADGTTQAANLQASGGRINLVSVASPGDVLLSNFQPAPNINGTSFTTMGTVSLREATVVDAGGQFDASGTPIGTGAGGTVFIRSGRLVLDASTIQANSVGPVDGASTAIELHVAQDMALSTGAQITVGAFGTGRAGDTTVTAESLSVSGGAGISTNSFSDGNGGNLSTNVGTLSLTESSTISSGNLSFGISRGGSISVQGHSVTLRGGSQILSETLNGAGGSLSITANSIALHDASSVKSSTTGFDAAGTIDLRVQNLTLLNGSTISSSTESLNPNPDAVGLLTIHGLAGAQSKADSVTLSGLETGILYDSTGSATLGEITVLAKTIRLSDGAVIRAGGTPGLPGTAGNVTLVADSVSLTGGSQIRSNAFAADARDVTITANTLTLDNGSILTETASSIGGRGGNVVLNVGTVNLSRNSIISSSSLDTGPGGNITINSRSVTVSDGSTISSNSIGTGNAGSISLNSRAAPGKSLEMIHGQINTSATLADGGNIEIYTTDRIRLTDSTITSSVGNATVSTTQGGNITIDPDFVILQRGEIRANAFAGSGGAIDVTAGLFLADPASVVDASSTLGVSGTVQINAPINNLSSVVARLPESLLAVQALLRASCAAKLAQGSTSSFVERGRDGIPAGPDGLLASPYVPPTSGYTAQRPASPVFSGIQLRRLFRKEMPASVTLISDQGGCVS